MGHHTGHLAQLQRHRRHIGELLPPPNVLHGPDHMKNDAQLVHYFFPAFRILICRFTM